MDALLPEALHPHVDLLLFLTFAIHFVVFGALSWTRRTRRYLSTLAMFAFMMGMHACKIEDFNPSLAGVDLQTFLRSMAHFCLGITVLALLHRRWIARQAR